MYNLIVIAPYLVGIGTGKSLPIKIIDINSSTFYYFFFFSYFFIENGSENVRTIGRFNIQQSANAMGK